MYLVAAEATYGPSGFSTFLPSLPVASDRLRSRLIVAEIGEDVRDAVADRLGAVRDRLAGVLDALGGSLGGVGDGLEDARVVVRLGAVGLAPLVAVGLAPLVAVGVAPGSVRGPRGRGVVVGEHLGIGVGVARFGLDVVAGLGAHGGPALAVVPLAPLLGDAHVFVETVILAHVLAVLGFAAAEVLLGGIHRLH